MRLNFVMATHTHTFSVTTFLTKKDVYLARIQEMQPWHSLEDLGIDGGIISKWKFRKEDERCRMDSYGSGQACGFHTVWGIS
jgi:hypothetical protein